MPSLCLWDLRRARYAAAGATAAILNEGVALPPPYVRARVPSSGAPHKPQARRPSVQPLGARAGAPAARRTSNAPCYAVTAPSCAPPLCQDLPNACRECDEYKLSIVHLRGGGTTVVRLLVLTFNMGAGGGGANAPGLLGGMASCFAAGGLYAARASALSFALVSYIKLNRGANLRQSHARHDRHSCEPGLLALI